MFSAAKAFSLRFQWTIATRAWAMAKCGSSSTRSEEHTSELQSRLHLVCRLLLEKKKFNEFVLTTELRHHISVGGLYTRAKAAAYISTGDDAGCGSVACETDRSECVRSAPAKLPA